MADGNITAARTRLGRAVQRLTAPRPAVYHDATVYQPSLWRSLLGELGGGQGEDRSPGKSQPPLWLDCCMLITEIKSTTRKWCTKPIPTEQRLQTLSFQSWRPQDTTLVEEMAGQVDHWCESIIGLLEPESRKFINAPCPSCGRTKVWRKNTAGEVVQQPALKLVVNQGCTCQHCQAFWSPERYLFLCRLLGFDLPEGVLE